MKYHPIPQDCFKKNGGFSGLFRDPERTMVKSVGGHQQPLKGSYPDIPNR